MIRIVLVVVAVISSAIFSAASAADIGKLEMPRSWTDSISASTAGHNWTGFYVGGNVGESFGGHDVNTTTVGNVTFDNGASLTSGMSYGGQVGMNYQLNPKWVVGIEADFQGGKQDHSTLQTFCCGFSQTTTVSVDWWGTVRGRAGYLIQPNWLVYGTGGLAYGNVRTDLTQYCPVQCFWQSTKQMSVGWTVGAGVEWAFLNNWSAKLEYLHVDLGSATNEIRAGAFTQTNKMGANFDVVRLGINYRF